LVTRRLYSGGGTTTNAEFHQQATLKLGETILVRLAGLGSSGYRWRIVESGSQVAIVRDRQTAEKRSLPPGGTADEVFRITATHVGETMVVLEQSRPWESGEALNPHILSLRIYP